MIYIIGDGGHARVVANVIDSLSIKYRMLSRDNEDQWFAWATREGIKPEIAIGIGMKKYKDEICPSLMHRYSVFQKYAAQEFDLPWLAHKQVYIPSSIQLGKAVQVMLGAIIQPGTRIDDAAIINTGAQVDHDCTIGMGAHIAPGAVICGGCKIGNCTLIGANATVLPGVSVGNHVVVGAAQVVRKDIMNAN